MSERRKLEEVKRAEAIEADLHVGEDGELELDLGPVNVEFVERLLAEVIEPNLVEELRREAAEREPFASPAAASSQGKEEGTSAERTLDTGPASA